MTRAIQKVFVTGANGHLGCNTVRELLKRDYLVKVLVREGSDTRGLKGLDVEWCKGDVLDLSSLVSGSKGCQAILHLAANFKFFAKTKEEIMGPAVLGTQNIFKAALTNGVQKMIYTSSIMAIGCADKPNKKLGQDDWLSDHSKEVYALAKRDSEKTAWELSKAYSIPLITILPGTIIGRYDYKITPSQNLIADFLRGKGLTNQMYLPLVDVRDVAQIHVQALERGTYGNRYFALSKAYAMKDVGKMFEELTGIKVWHIPSPRALDILLGKILESLGKITPWEPPVTEALARFFSHRYCNFDYDPTIKDFNYVPRPLKEILIDSIKWLGFLGVGKVKEKYKARFLPEDGWVK